MDTLSEDMKLHGDGTLDKQTARVVAVSPSGLQSLEQGQQVAGRLGKWRRPVLDNETVRVELCADREDVGEKALVVVYDDDQFDAGHDNVARHLGKAGA